MPRYEYYCDANGREVEVSHPMSERLATWGELCERAGIPRGRTAADAPVEKLISAGAVVSANVRKTPSAPPCGQGGGCGSGRCSYE